jgi:hypothetical protein
MLEQWGWYLTRPWEPVSIRRGDALGFRAASDYCADLLAPGLSNSTSDARWISLLSWCLKWSHVAWKSAGGSDLSRRDDQRARYAWLRPLELLWVDRTLESGQTTGQLRGRRSIERWRREDRRLRNFAMSPEQFRRYRQAGMYGAYRVVLRKVPLLTTDNGWTPDAIGLALADLVNDRLPRDARLRQEHFENGTKWGVWSNGNEARYWEEHGWQASWSQVGGFLPTPDDALGKQLPEQERRLLAPTLFAIDTTRRVTAEVLASAKSARSHADLCEALANSSSLARVLDSTSLAPLPAFSRFADAAMDAMRKLWKEINQDAQKQAPPVEKLVRSADLKLRFERLREEGGKWLNSAGRSAFPREHIVTQLAEAMSNAAALSDQVRTLSRHHHEHGGGRRWFREESGKLVPLVPHNGIVASDYRFRLRSLCLLAAQCGVAKMDNPLNAMTQEAEDEEEKDYL